LLRRLRLRRKTSAWTSSGPAGVRRLEREEQLGRSKAEKRKYYLLYLNSGNVTIAAT
jgi:hypothetical protein